MPLVDSHTSDPYVQPIETESWRKLEYGAGDVPKFLAHVLADNLEQQWVNVVLSECNTEIADNQMTVTLQLRQWRSPVKMQIIIVPGDGLPQISCTVDAKLERDVFIAMWSSLLLEKLQKYCQTTYGYTLVGVKIENAALVLELGDAIHEEQKEVIPQVSPEMKVYLDAISPIKCRALLADPLFGINMDKIERIITTKLSNGNMISLIAEYGQGAIVKHYEQIAELGLGSYDEGVLTLSIQSTDEIDTHLHTYLAQQKKCDLPTLQKILSLPEDQGKEFVVDHTQTVKYSPEEKIILHLIVQEKMSAKTVFGQLSQERITMNFGAFQKFLYGLSQKDLIQITPVCEWEKITDLLLTKTSK